MDDLLSVFSLVSIT